MQEVARRNGVHIPGLGYPGLANLRPQGQRSTGKHDTLLTYQGSHVQLRVSFFSLLRWCEKHGEMYCRGTLQLHQPSYPVAVVRDAMCNMGIIPEPV